MMHPELHRYLDGEAPEGTLPPELAGEAAGWDRLLGAAEELRAEVAAPWIEARVMNALPKTPRAPAWRRALAWLLQPQSIRVRPIGALCAAAIGAFLFAAWPAALPVSVDTPASLAGAAASASLARPASAASGAPVYVQFVFEATDARSVTVAGDFNEWQPNESSLSDPDGDGVWTGLVPVTPGLHQYMFVVDGNRWVMDPRASRYVEDGFGMKNALLSVPNTQSAT